jgi:hypothetical protein
MSSDPTKLLNKGSHPVADSISIYAKLKIAASRTLETMPTDKHLARHDSQISRLEQVMTALAEAQVKGEDDMAVLRRSMAALAKAQVKTDAQMSKTDAQMAQLGQTMNALAEAQIKTEAEVSKLSAQTRALGRQWQAYLSTLSKN